ncbi:MAG TPA: hypothetical protein VFV68_17520 [Agriterribacter sp.]|nr:hypothetical protein [Agriterribacter sp.]
MKNKFLSLVASLLLMLNCNAGGNASNNDTGRVKFFVDPATNSDDPEIRMAYGLNIVPPWPDGGSVFVNLPEHLEYMPGTKGIARHHDKRTNVWQTSPDSSEAHYAVESITEPGVFFSVKALATNGRAIFEMTITNHSEKILNSIRPMFCFQYNLLKGFPVKFSDNFAHTFVIINGKPVEVTSLSVKNTHAIARMAQVGSCVDKHNWWAEQMGGFIGQPIDAAYTILTAAHDVRKVILHWFPGKNLLSNSAIPCIHADPCVGDLAPGDSRTVHGELIFTCEPLDEVIKEFTVK